MNGTAVTREEQTLVVTQTERTACQETVLVEQPVEVALNEVLIGTTMVMPADLEALAVGFLFGQGYLSSPQEVVEVLTCPQGRMTVYARVEDPPRDRSREMIVTSGCGGSGRIPRGMLQEEEVSLNECSLDFSDIRGLIKGTLQASDLSVRTHCVHACSFWSEGELKVCCEDVGRHNAVDKVIGTLLLQDIPPGGAVYTTGRLTSDIVLKCARIGVPILISRTAPSSLGLDIARQAGITLAAYARPNRLNCFNRPERIRQGDRR
ncbi:MAG: formate dehydrogenase accessory sulfurtransferase FdhD [Desulfohalobiaceae bacterium]|nr:formate dehydrogenase accessory sulfurtransferase FdhD [Desulfohalobiaceae bacterium]